MVGSTSSVSLVIELVEAMTSRRWCLGYWLERRSSSKFVWWLKWIERSSAVRALAGLDSTWMVMSNHWPVTMTMEVVFAFCRGRRPCGGFDILSR